MRREFLVYHRCILIHVPTYRNPVFGMIFPRNTLNFVQMLLHPMKKKNQMKMLMFRIRFNGNVNDLIPSQCKREKNKTLTCV